MLMEIIVMTILFVFVLLGGHLFIWHSLCFFYCLKRKTKYYLAIPIFIMPIIFLGSTALTRKFDTELIHYLYVLATAWLGMAIYLIQSFIIAWIIYYFIKNKFKIKKHYFATTVIIFVLIIITYGLVNGQVIKIKNIEIKINNLPSSLENKKIVHLTDIHLGAINRQAYMERIIKKTEEIKPDYIFLTGDYLDGTSPNSEKFIPLLASLNEIAQVYFITGNHEDYDSIENLSELVKNTECIILENEITTDDGMQIIGFSYTEKNEDYNLELFKKLNQGLPSILLTHDPVLMNEAKENDIDLHLSGHTHRGQIFPANFLTYLIYGRYQYGLNIDGDYKQYTSSGTGTWGPPLRILTDNEIVVFTLKK
jgi:predicted MPP superfamily phosphohydrolase